MVRPSGPNSQGARLGRTHDQIVKVAPNLEAARLFDPTDLQWLKASRADQPVNFVAGFVIIGHVEENRSLG